MAWEGSVLPCGIRLGLEKRDEAFARVEALPPGARLYLFAALRTSEPAPPLRLVPRVAEAQADLEQRKHSEFGLQGRGC